MGQLGSVHSAAGQEPAERPVVVERFFGSRLSSQTYFTETEDSTLRSFQGKGEMLFVGWQGYICLENLLAVPRDSDRVAFRVPND